METFIFFGQTEYITPSETDVAAQAISGWDGIGWDEWSLGGLKYRAAFAANNTKMTDEIQDI